MLPVRGSKIEYTRDELDIIAHGSESKLWRMTLLPGRVGASSQMLAIMPQTRGHRIPTAIEHLDIPLR